MSLDSSRIYYGDSYIGIGVLRLSGGKWIDEGKIIGTSEEMRELYVDNKGVIWGSVDDNTLVRVEVRHSENKTELISRKIYGKIDGLPTPSPFYPFTINDIL